MKPATAVMTQVDELPGEEIEFSIGDPRWVMRSMADLYSNRELAVTREYSTNAFDANKEVAIANGAVPAPIHVTLPTMMDPYFKVRDYGYGMTLDVLREVYTKFGTSTKRDSNDYNGMLGYGSKSAVAYATQFIVTSIAQGVKTIAVVTRKPDWSIVMKIVSQVKSDDPTGTEISVPVHNPDEFRTKANAFYKFWKPGTVLVDGVEPVQEVGEQISDNFYYSVGNNSYIVMGNVPYRIENPSALFYGKNMRAINFVVYVDTGDVEFTPNREALKYTDLTKATLQSVIDEFADRMRKTAQAEIDAATTHPEAYAAWTKWGGMLGEGLFGKLTFKGDTFKRHFDINAYRYYYGRRNGSRRIQDYEVEKAPKTLFILNCGVGNPPASWKSKAVEYRELMKLSTTAYVFVSGASINCPWIDQTGDNFVTWEDLKAALPKKPRESNGGGGRTKDNKGSFDIYSGTRRHYDIEIPEDYKASKYFYINPGVMKQADYSMVNIINHLPTEHRDVSVVVVGMNRMNKFKKDYPFIREFIPFAKSLLVKDGGSLLSDDSKKIMSLSNSEQNWIKKLKSERLDDPDFALYNGMYTKGIDRDAYDRNYSLSQYLKMWSYVNTYAPQQTEFFFTKYPLLRYINSYNVHEDIYVYLNAAYAARKDKK